MDELSKKDKSRGYFEIGIVNGKTPQNLGTLWRSAYQLGASGIFTIGKRWKKHPTDTYKSWRHIPYRDFETFEEFQNCRPYSCVLVSVEMGGENLSEFNHPERAIYLLGAEDHGLTNQAIKSSQHIISLQGVRKDSFNVAVAGSLIMYDRASKNGGFNNG